MFFRPFQHDSTMTSQMQSTMYMPNSQGFRLAESARRNLGGQEEPAFDSIKEALNFKELEDNHLKIQDMIFTFQSVKSELNLNLDFIRIQGEKINSDYHLLNLIRDSVGTTSKNQATSKDKVEDGSAFLTSIDRKETPSEPQRVRNLHKMEDKRVFQQEWCLKNTNGIKALLDQMRDKLAV